MVLTKLISLLHSEVPIVPFSVLNPNKHDAPSILHIRNYLYKKANESIPKSHYLLLGRGSHGSVFESKEDASKAIKECYKPLSEVVKEATLQNFIAKTFGFAPKVYAILQNEDYCFLVMEKIQGRTLQEISKENIPYLQKLKILSKTLKLISLLHQHSFLHGDISIRNIMINQSENPILIDFGNSEYPYTDLKKENGYIGNLILDFLVAPRQTYQILPATPLNKCKKLEMMLSSNLNMPQKDSSTWAQICYKLIEHTRNATPTLSEIQQILASKILALE